MNPSYAPDHPPKTPHAHLHPCITWAFLLSAFALAVQPMAILAQEGPSTFFGSPPSGQTSQQGQPPTQPPFVQGDQQFPQGGGASGVSGTQQGPTIGGSQGNFRSGGSQGGSQDGGTGGFPGGSQGGFQGGPSENGITGSTTDRGQNFPQGPGGTGTSGSEFGSKNGGPQGRFQGGSQDGQLNGTSDSGTTSGQQGDANAQSDEMMKKQEKAAVDRMKKGMVNFARQIARIKSRLAALAKKGVTVPQEVTDAVASAEDTIAKVNAAQTLDDIDAVGDIASILDQVSQTLQDQLPNLERLANLPKIYSRIDKQLKAFDRQLASDQALAKRSKIDISGEVADFESALSKLKDAYAAAKAQIATGDIEQGFDALQSDVFDAMDDIGEHHANIQQIGRLSTTIAQAGRDLTKFQRQITNLKRQGKDTSAAQTVLDEGTAKAAELKTVAAAKPIDPDVVFGVLQELQDIRDRFVQELDKLTGTRTQSDLDVGIQAQTLNIPDLGNLTGGSAGQGSAGQ